MWIGKNGHSVYSTTKGIDLSGGNFHSGTVFEGTLDLEAMGDDEALRQALADGYQPVFYVFAEQKS